MAVAYLGLGSNLGDRTQHLQRACETLHRHPSITVQTVSSLYHTAPVGVIEQDWFVNAVARLDTTLPSRSLLTITQSIERRLGRVPMFHWGPRVIDIDILLYDSLQVNTPFLTIPHAALQDRLFVITPLHELAPDLQLPAGPLIRDLLAGFADQDSVQKIGVFPAFHHDPDGA